MATRKTPIDDAGERWRKAARQRTNRGEILELTDPAAATLAQIRAARDLDDVLAIGTPNQIVASLFDTQASKTLIEPLGDAIVRGLIYGTNSYSSIAFASALRSTLDTGRLAEVLSLDDHGFALVPAVTPTNFMDDLQRVFGNYKDASRRRRLASTLWHVVLQRHLRIQRADRFLEDARKYASKNLANADSYGKTIFESISAEMPSKQAAAMVVEWCTQRFCDAELAFARMAVYDRDATVYFVAREQNRIKTSRNEQTTAAASVFVEAMRTAGALRDLALHLPKGKANWGTISQGLSSRLTRDNLFELAEDLVRLSTSDAEGDAERIAAYGPLNDYIGLRTHINFSVPEYTTTTIPALTYDLPSSIAQVAQLVRFGAELPSKPKSWAELLADTCKPYYVNEALKIAAPSWTARVHNRQVPGTTLIARAPQDMTELVRWAEYMGNCIASYFGEAVRSGKNVILGLFDGDELKYNVGIESKSMKVFEVESRFNNGNVPPEVGPGIAGLLAEARRIEIPTPTKARARVPKGEGTKRRTGPPPAQKRALIELADDIRAYENRELYIALESLAEVAGSRPADAAGWINLVGTLRRFRKDDIKTAFADAVRNAPLPGAWALLSTHPLDAAINATHPTLSDQSLRIVRAGDERAKLTQTSWMLDRSEFDAAWRLGKLQQALRSAVVELIQTEPLALRSLIRDDATGAARRALSLVFVGLGDADERVVENAGQLQWFDIADRETAMQSWADAHLIAPAVITSLLASIDITAVDDPAVVDFALRRESAGLRPAQCPRQWFTRARRP